MKAQAQARGEPYPFDHAGDELWDDYWRIQDEIRAIEAGTANCAKCGKPLGPTKTNVRRKILSPRMRAKVGMMISIERFSMSYVGMINSATASDCDCAHASSKRHNKATMLFCSARIAGCAGSRRPISMRPPPSGCLCS